MNDDQRPLDAGEALRVGPNPPVWHDANESELMISTPEMDSRQYARALRQRLAGEGKWLRLTLDSQHAKDAAASYDARHEPTATGLLAAAARSITAVAVADKVLVPMDDGRVLVIKDREHQTPYYQGMQCHVFTVSKRGTLAAVAGSFMEATTMVARIFDGRSYAQDTRYGGEQESLEQVGEVCYSEVESGQPPWLDTYVVIKRWVMDALPREYN